jgi:hypothetical protein
MISIIYKFLTDKECLFFYSGGIIGIGIFNLITEDFLYKQYYPFIIGIFYMFYALSPLRTMIDNYLSIIK